MKKILYLFILLSLIITNQEVSAATSAPLKASDLKTVEEAGIKNLGYTLDIDVNTESFYDGVQSLFGIKLNSLGVIAYTKDSYDSDSLLKISAKGVLPSISSDTSPFKVSATLQSIGLKKDAYILLKKLSLDGSDMGETKEMLDEYIKPLKNKWIKFDKKTLASEGGDTLKVTEREFLIKRLKEWENSGAITLVKLPDQTKINKITLDHYSVNIDLNLLANDLAKESFSPSSSTQTELEEIISRIAINKLEIWVDPKTKVIHKTSFDIFTYTVSDQNTVESRIQVIGNFGINSINKAKKIKAPAKSTTLEKLLEKMYY